MIVDMESFTFIGKDYGDSIQEQRELNTVKKYLRRWDVNNGYYSRQESPHHTHLKCEERKQTTTSLFKHQHQYIEQLLSHNDLNKL